MICIKQSFFHLLKSIKSVFTNLVNFIRDVALLDFIRDVAYGIKSDLLEAALKPPTFVSAFISTLMKFMFLIYWGVLLTIAMAFVLFIIATIVCLLVNLWYIFVPIVCFVASIAIVVGVIRLIHHDEIVKNKVVDEARDDEDLNSPDDSGDDKFDDRNDDKANDDNEFKEGKK